MFQNISFFLWRLTWGNSNLHYLVSKYTSMIKQIYLLLKKNPQLFSHLSLHLCLLFLLFTNLRLDFFKNAFFLLTCIVGNQIERESYKIILGVPQGARRYLHPLPALPPQISNFFCCIDPIFFLLEL